MKNLFKKPKYKIYACLLLVLVLWILHATLTPDVKAKDVGNVNKGARIECEGFNFSAQMASDSSGNVQGVIELYFDDAAKIPREFLLATDYQDWLLRDISVQYSYTLDGKQDIKTVSNFQESSDIKSALSGISFQQPFPHGAKDRRLIFHQTARGVSSLSAEGYIAAGDELYHCDLRDGILYSINSRRAYRFGSVQLIRFTFQMQH